MSNVLLSSTARKASSRDFVFPLLHGELSPAYEVRLISGSRNIGQRSLYEARQCCSSLPGVAIAPLPRGLWSPCPRGTVSPAGEA